MQPEDALSICDREPIHAPGAVQPHGVLLVADPRQFTILHVSENAGDLLGVEVDGLLGVSLRALLGERMTRAIERLLAGDGDPRPRYLPAMRVGPTGVLCDGTAHCHGGKLIVELEGRAPAGAADTHEVYAALGEVIRRLDSAPSLEALYRAVAEQVRAFTGFDRVMVYRFHEDDSGSVVAEAMRDGLESYLGLRYPASDIPRPARELYLRSWLRMIPDVDARPSGIISTESSRGEDPIDLSYAVIRSVSPVHLEYLRNMGVRASMSISLLRGGKLWGLVACHHTTARLIPQDARMACEFLAHMLSLQLGAKGDAEEREYARALDAHRARIVAAVLAEDSYPRGLLSPSLDLLGWIPCGGVALVVPGAVTLLGRTPPEPEVQRLVDWLIGAASDEVFATDHLAGAGADVPLDPAVASGVLALRLGGNQREYLVWFRPELPQVVTWGGDPSKAIGATLGSARVSPRKSFAAWKATVRGRSAPWRACEIESARSLRRDVVDLLLRKAEKVAALNVELERSNVELDDFAHIASHDLKEPLRGIHNYSHFLLEDYGDRIDTGGRTKLQTMARLTQRLEGLLDSLLHYSRVGRADIYREDTDLQAVLEQALEALATRIQESGAAVRVPRRLPRILADKERAFEIFVNLITNALKYNDKPDRWVEIGFEEARPGPDDTVEPPVFYVRDNGIGIPAKHHEAVFRIFKRLHGRDAYGGGLGAGLTIVKKIVERHGGTIWLDSTQGEGTTFYFTLG